MNQKEQLFIQLRELFNKRTWLDTQLMAKPLAGYQPSEIHCLEFIGKHPAANVTKMADSLFMTRGAISKITKKLLNKEVIERYQKKENKKEIFFRLTEKGQAIFATHERLHKEIDARDDVIFQQITPEQYEQLFAFIKLYTHHLDQEIAKIQQEKEH